jgi:hypothetical protein
VESEAPVASAIGSQAEAVPLAKLEHAELFLRADLSGRRPVEVGRLDGHRAERSAVATVAFPARGAPVEGLLVHVAGEGENGFRVVDVWESEEAFRRFGETLMPVLREIGVQGQPEVYPAHTLVSA